MKSLLLKTKIFAMLAVIGVVCLAAGSTILFLMEGAKNDADIVNALGRQRMLSQAMGKSVLGYAMKKNLVEDIRENVVEMDNYITNMRKSYTQLVIGPAKAAGMAVSMDPKNEAHPAVPFPATLTRQVNTNHSTSAELSVDIIAESPVNPKQGLKTEMDAKANAFLKANPDKVYMEPLEAGGALRLVFYTADRATVDACVSCHIKLEDKPYKIGDLLGIRRFELPFSADVAAGNDALKPTLDEYRTAEAIFTKTLKAMRSGGDYPVDLAMKKSKTVNAIDDLDIQKTIGAVDENLAAFRKTAEAIASGSVSKQDRHKAVGDILTQSNRLRKVSNDFVVQFAAIANQKQSMIRYATLAAMIVTIAIVIVIAAFFLRGIISPLRRIGNVMTVMAEGDTEAEVPDRDRQDEIGDMAGSVQVFKENMIRNRKLEADQAKAREAQAKRAETIEDRTGEFDRVVSSALETVTTSSTQMQASSESLSATAEKTNAQSVAVAAAAEQASANVQTVASAAEELSSSISEISRQVGQSTSIAADAVSQVEGANEQVQGLADAAQKIGEVVSLITDIAEQTNLLALNATIEAARAGDAGKGFAVVASEVKNLANQTAKATDEIGAQISGIQTATHDAVAAIEGIGAIIKEISEISTAIAAAVEEQGAATQEIARNVEQAATGTKQVTTNIGDVTKAAGETGDSSSQVLEAAKDLARQADSLRDEVDSFLSDIKAA